MKDCVCGWASWGCCGCSCCRHSSSCLTCSAQRQREGGEVAEESRHLAEAFAECGTAFMDTNGSATTKAGGVRPFGGPVGSSGVHPAPRQDYNCARRAFEANYRGALGRQLTLRMLGRPAPRTLPPAPSRGWCAHETAGRFRNDVKPEIVGPLHREGKRLCILRFPEQQLWRFVG
jgi:hypothetical protein